MKKVTIHAKFKVSREVKDILKGIANAKSEAVELAFRKDLTTHNVKIAFTNETAKEYEFYLSLIK